MIYFFPDFILLHKNRYFLSCSTFRESKWLVSIDFSFLLCSVNVFETKYFCDQFYMLSKRKRSRQLVLDFVLNPSRPDPGRREKIKAFKAFIKPFEVPQRSVKIKIQFNFCFNQQKCWNKTNSDYFLSKTKVTSYSRYSILYICDALGDLVLFVQFKKLEKHSRQSVTFSKLESCNFTKSNTTPWLFFTRFKLC